MSRVKFTQTPFSANSLTDDAASKPYSSFVVGDHYSRDAVGNIIDYPIAKREGGVWDTGYFRWNDEIFIFCNIGAAGRTGHDYPNRWYGKNLIWYGKTGSAVHQPMMRDMLGGNVPVHVFWRGKDRSPFTYAGLARAVDFRKTIPIEIMWAFAANFPQEVQPPGAEQRFRRGPPPSSGIQAISKIDGPASVYVMILCGPVFQAMPSVEREETIVKIGMSNSPERRLLELNSGFPPGCDLRWELFQTKLFDSGKAAYLYEGSILDRLRMDKQWIGGEFARVPSGQLASLMQN